MVLVRYVRPSIQRQSQAQIVFPGLARCKQLGFVTVVVLGHAEHYLRFGFFPSSRFEIDCEYDVPEEAFMRWNCDQEHYRKVPVG